MWIVGYNIIIYKENTIMFLKKFNVVDKPEIVYQQELL